MMSQAALANSSVLQAFPAGNRSSCSSKRCECTGWQPNVRLCALLHFCGAVVYMPLSTLITALVTC
jgi:hypothetical protein